MKKAHFYTLLGLFFAVNIGYGALVSRTSLVDLQQKADLIVVGTASDGLWAGTTASFKIQVDRVLKGEATVGGIVQVSWLAGGATAGDASSIDGSGLWFLQSSSGGWTLLPVFQGAAAFTRTFIPEQSGPILSFYTYAPTAVIGDKLALEIAAAIEEANGGGPDLIDIQFDLDHLSSPVASGLYQRMANASPTPENILGLSGLIRGGSGDALNTAVRAIKTFSGFPMETGVLVRSIRDEFRATDSTSVGVLGQAAANSQDSNLSFRRAASHALASIHTSDALPFLAALLNDEDATIQAEAAGGLALFANGLPVQSSSDVAGLGFLQLPASAPYQTPETIGNLALGDAASQHVSFWRNWWTQNKATLGY